MTITKPTKKIVEPSENNAEAFISGAPDGQAVATAAVATTTAGGEKTKKHVRKGNKLQITFTISEPMLDRVDSLAKKLGLSRAAVINLAIHQGIENGISVMGVSR